MPVSIPTSTLEKFTAFGDLLRYLRRRVGMTQMELADAVGYSDAQISRLEQNLRLPDLPTIQAHFVPALGLEDEPKAVARLLELAANVRREDAPALGLCPYKGLTYFDEADADLFVGREVLTEKVAQRVLALATDEMRFLAVVGASGSGKSSLVRAGLVPALHWNRKSAEWRVHIFTPTAHPLESLAASLTDNTVAVSAIAALADELARDPKRLHLFVKNGVKAGSRARRLLVIDQFEELFALCRSEQERASFIGNLLAAASEPDGPVFVVITLRADFYAHCASYPELREALARQQEYIGAMTDPELRRAVEEPARRARWEFEPGLVDVLLHDVGHEPGALPLLSHALWETWQRRRGRRMTHGGYASSGGVRGAIAETAETVFTDQFTREQQAIARRIFLRLSELGDEAAAGDTRRRATFDELILKPEEAATTRAVLKALADARLITTSEDAAEVAHEALIREWPTLHGWLEENREGLRLHRQLTDAAGQWLAMDREADVLYRGARLAQTLEWANGHDTDLNTLEQEFLDASSQLAQREVDERETQRQRELEAAQRLTEEQARRADEQAQAAGRLRRRALLLGGAFALAILLAGVAAFFGDRASKSAAAAQDSALSAQHNAAAAQNAQATAQANASAALRAQATAQAERDRADAGRIAAEGNNLLQNSSRDANLIALLAIRSLDETYTPAGDVLLNHVTDLPLPPQEFKGHTDDLWGVDISPDGKYLATGSADNTARLWDIASGESLRTFVGHTGDLGQVKFSPDGKYLATTSVDGTDRLWDVATGETVREFTGCPGAGGSVEFSPDGKYLLSPCWAPPTLIWDVATGQTVHALARADGPEFVPRATYSADGKYVATVGIAADEHTNPTARVFDAATGNEVLAISLPAAGTSVAFSPDSQHFAIGHESGRITLWDINSGEMVREYVGHSDFLQAIRFSADGRYLLSGSNDTTARLWDVASGETIRIFGGHGGEVREVALTRDGSLVATAGFDRIARVWSLRASPIGVQFAGPLGIARQASFSPDGERVVTAHADGNARIWDATTGQLSLTLAGHTDAVRGAVFSPDGKWVLTASADRTARLWDAASGEELRKFEGHADWVNRAIFSPDAKQVVSSSNDGSSRAWDTQTGQPIWVYSPPAGASRVTFSPGGKTVAVASRGPSTSILDFLTGERLMVFHLSGEIMNDVSFSADGNYLCAFDTAYFLWDMRTGQQVQPADGAPACGEFSPDGRYFATIHPDNSVRLWDAQTRQEMRRFANPSDVYKVAFSPDGKYILAADADGTARMWLINLDEAISAQCAALTRDFTPAEREQYGISDDSPTCPAEP